MPLRAWQNINPGEFVKYANVRAFEKHLEGAAPQHFSDIYMILSKDSYDRKTALDQLIRTMRIGEQNPQFSLRYFDGESHSVDEIMQEMETISFFVKKRLVVVQNIDKLDKKSTERLEAYFTSPNPSVCLVLVGTAINRATTFYKKTEKAGVILDVADEKPWEKEKSLAEWLKKEAEVRGKTIDLPCCQIILKQMGTDQGLLFQELEKLCCYIGERPAITAKDVAAICSQVNSENAWQLSESIFKRDAASAVRISKALIADGVALIALLRQIRSQFQTEYQVCSILANGGSGYDVAQTFPYMKGPILERHLQMSRAFGMEKFKQGILKIDETELAAKNSSIDPDFLLEVLMIKLTM